LRSFLKKGKQVNNYTSFKLTKNVNTLSYKTVSVSSEKAVRSWYVVDAEGQTVGRLSSQIASILRGKNKPSYTPHADTGDYIIVINAEKVRFTGRKFEQKEYRDYSLHPGGLKVTKAHMMLDKFPERILERAVRGMLPKNTLGRAIVKKMYVYVGTDHPHAAQKPQTIVLTQQK
jgi:large subunit ribosomal protein L13